jgi:hypothetical protein
VNLVAPAGEAAGRRSSALLGQARLPGQQAAKPSGTEMIAGFARLMGGCAPGQTPAACFSDGKGKEKYR